MFQHKGLVVYDIPYDIVPSKFLQVILQKHNMGFNLFLYRSVIVPTTEYLHKVFVDDYGSDIDSYSDYYYRMLHDGNDDRSGRGVSNNIKVYQDCIDNGTKHVNYLDVSYERQAQASRKRRADDTSPVRIRLFVSDMLDIRASAGMFNLPLWQYMGELISEGMFKIYVIDNTTPDEKALLMDNVDTDVSPIIVHDARMALYDRLSIGYVQAFNDCYNNSPPRLRTGFDQGSLGRVRDSFMDGEGVLSL